MKPKKPLAQFTAEVKAQTNISPPQIGDKYRNFVNDLLHIRGIVDDQVVFRRWRKGKGWIYACEPLWYFEPSEGFVLKVK